MFKCFRTVQRYLIFFLFNIASFRSSIPDQNLTNLIENISNWVSKANKLTVSYLYLSIAAVINWLFWLFLLSLGKPCLSIFCEKFQINIVNNFLFLKDLLNNLKVIWNPNKICNRLIMTVFKSWESTISNSWYLKIWFIFESRLVSLSFR